MRGCLVAQQGRHSRMLRQIRCDLAWTGKLCTRFSEGKTALIRQLVSEGLTSAEIAAWFGTTPGFLRVTLRPPWHPAAAPWTTEAAARTTVHLALRARRGSLDLPGPQRSGELKRPCKDRSERLVRRGARQATERANQRISALRPSDLMRAPHPRNESTIAQEW